MCKRSLSCVAAWALFRPLKAIFRQFVWALFRRFEVSSCNSRQFQVILGNFRVQQHCAKPVLISKTKLRIAHTKKQSVFVMVAYLLHNKNCYGVNFLYVMLSQPDRGKIFCGGFQITLQELLLTEHCNFYICITLRDRNSLIYLVRHCLVN